MAHPTRGVYQPSDLCPRDDRLTGTRRPLGAFPSLFQATCEAPGHVGHHLYRIAYSFQHRCTLPPLADAGRTHTTFAPPQWGPPNRAGRTGRLPKGGQKPLLGRPDSWRQEQGLWRCCQTVAQHRLRLWLVFFNVTNI